MIGPHYHRLYGLLAESELPFPELATAATGQPDISFRRVGVAQAAPKHYKPLGPFHAAAPGRLWLHVPGVARFLVRDGVEVGFDPHPGVDEDSLRVFLLGPCLGALLMQRGLLVLRGCAVQVGDGCVVVLGGPAAGKSTLAAELARRGHAVLSDDLVVLDGAERVISGPPVVKLWCDAADKLGINVAGLKRVHPQLEKYYLPLKGGAPDAVLPVQEIFVLESSNIEDFRFTDIRGMNRFEYLLEYGYRPLYLDGMGLKAGHVRSCAGLAGKVRMQSLHRPKRPLRVEELAERLLASLEGQG